MSRHIPTAADDQADGFKFTKPGPGVYFLIERGALERFMLDRPRPLANHVDTDTLGVFHPPLSCSHTPKPDSPEPSTAPRR